MKKFYSPWPNSPSSTGEPRGTDDYSPIDRASFFEEKLKEQEKELYFNQMQEKEKKFTADQISGAIFAFTNTFIDSKDILKWFEDGCPVIK